MIVDRLYKHRFEIFLGTQITILFGSLFFPLDFYEFVLLPILYLLSIAAGILMISKRKKLTWFFIGLFVIAAFMFGSSMISRNENMDNIFIRLTIYFVFHIIVTWNIIQQVWGASFVNKNVIMGLMSGYISLGFLAFFLFMTIELLNPGSFTCTLLQSEDPLVRFDSILYYAYITLLTIGYGEIVPTTAVAQKAAILVGLVGQFYMVIITAVIVEKYIVHSKKL
ncbi:ion channel [Aquimarina gracilis]|uniref:Ion channel n=1 Tax=Aquimarina gracilis TaxID=874422 RepID=A0ABU5ZV12_9FLAO|nr:ion channel [Aquimarina gracilis]MEB3345818.1 ion channel [Aquimarina gracilis]